MPDNDLQVRTLLTDAAGDVPPGIDLLHGFRARQAARRVRGRIRVRVALATAAGGLLAAATAVTLTTATAPSARAQLTSAASRTAGLSYDFSATVATTPLRADGAERAQSGRVSGEFDPAHRTGEMTLNGFGSDGETRFIGPYVYLYTPARPGRPAFLDHKSWIRAPSSELWEPATAGQDINFAAGLGSLAVTSPQNLFALLKSASTVDRQGSASGDGWTGTSYAFTARITFGPNGNSLPSVTAAGTVAVDQQGRVRRLTLAYTQPAQASLPPIRVTVEMAFSGFGTRVSVSPPPASEVFIPANIQIQPAPAP